MDRSITGKFAYGSSEKQQSEKIAISLRHSHIIDLG